MTPVAPNAKPLLKQDPNLIYFSQEFAISQTPDAELVAKVSIRQAYQLDQPKAFTLKVPVKFPAAISSKTIAGYMDCTPKISNPGTYVAAKSESEGEFTFSASIEEGAEFKCTAIEVLPDQKTRYEGAFAGSDGAFTAAAEKVVTLKQVTLKDTTPVVPSDGNVHVDVTVKPCPDGFVYDTTLRDCKKK